MSTTTLYRPSVKVAPIAQGDAYVTDHGLAWYDLVEDSFQWAGGNYDPKGLSYLEAIEHVGVLARPYLGLKDTLKAHWAFSGSGNWEDRDSVSGSPGVKRLMQYLVDTTSVYLATCNFTHPQDPNFALTLIIPPSPRTWDTTGLPPYVRLEFGNGEWAVHFEATGNYLLRWIAERWVVVGDLDDLSLGQGYAQIDEKVLFIRCASGKLLVSTNYGKTYKRYENFDDTPIVVAGGKFGLRGQGGQVIFGIHELQYQNGSYLDSVTINTFTSRLAVFPTFDLTRSFLPPGTNIVMTDRSDPFIGKAAYRATFTTTFSARTNLRYYYTPVLRATVMQYPVAVSSFIPDSDTPWDAKLWNVNVTDPFELANSTATWRFDIDPGDAVDENYRLRKVQIVVYVETWDNYETDSPTLTHTDNFVLFTGYITGFTLNDGDGEGAFAEFTAGTLAAKLKRTEWDFNWIIPLGGLDAGTAADLVLYTEGLTAADRAWWEPISSAWLLPFGLHREPFMMLKRKQKKWRTLEDIFSYPQLELGVLRDGTLATVPKNYYTGVVHQVQGQIPTDKKDLSDAVVSLQTKVNYQDTTTVAITYAKAFDGSGLVGFIVDLEAEQNPTSPRFCPQREAAQQDVDFKAETGTVQGKTLDLAYDMLVKKKEPDLQIPLGRSSLAIGRRDFIQPYGMADLQLEDGVYYWVMSMTRNLAMDRRSGKVNLNVSAGVRKIEGLYLTP